MPGLVATAPGWPSDASPGRGLRRAWLALGTVQMCLALPGVHFRSRPPMLSLSGQCLPCGQMDREQRVLCGALQMTGESL